MQSVAESSSSNVSTPRVVISELKCHGGYPHYIRFGPPDVALPVTLLLLLGRTKGVHDGFRIRPAWRFIIGLLCWISKASRTYLLPQLSSLTRILASFTYTCVWLLAHQELPTWVVMETWHLVWYPSPKQCISKGNWWLYHSFSTETGWAASHVVVGMLILPLELVNTNKRSRLRLLSKGML